MTGILEPDEFFELKLLITHRTDSTPRIVALGKVAGQKLIEVGNSITEAKDSSKASFWQAAFSGGILTQGVRTLCYGLLLLTILGAVIAVLVNSNTEKQTKREALVEAFCKKQPAGDYIHPGAIELFKLYDYDDLKFLRDAMVDDQSLHDAYSQSILAYFEKPREEADRQHRVFSKEHDLFQTAIKLKVIKYDDEYNTVSVNKKAYHTVDTYLAFLDTVRISKGGVYDAEGIPGWSKATSLKRI